MRWVGGVTHCGVVAQVKDVMKDVMAGLQQTNSEKILLSWVRQNTRQYPQVGFHSLCVLDACLLSKQHFRKMVKFHENVQLGGRKIKLRNDCILISYFGMDSMI